MRYRSVGERAWLAPIYQPRFMGDLDHTLVPHRPLSYDIRCACVPNAVGRPKPRRSYLNYDDEVRGLPKWQRTHLVLSSAMEISLFQGPFLSSHCLLTENARPVGATMSKRPEAARAEHVAAQRRPKLGNPFARELDQGMAPDRPLHRF